MKKIILKCLLIVVILATIAVGAYFILRACGFTTAAKFVELRDNLGDTIWLWLIIGLLQVIQVIFVPISNQIITVPCALVFNDELWKVWLTSWISIWIATMILYFLGRWGGKKVLNWVLNDAKKTETCSNWLKRGWMFYPLGMLLPLPDDIITVLAGTAKMNLLFVVLCSFLTRGVDTACSVYGFGYLTRFGWGWGVLINGFIVLGIISVWFWKWQNKKAEKDIETK